GALAIAMFMDLTQSQSMIIILPVTILSAILLLWTGNNTKIKGDAAVAMISVGSMAIGYMIMNLSPNSSNVSGDVCTSLFGSTAILTLTQADLWLCSILSGVVVILFILFYNRIFSVTFDENFAKAAGARTNAINLFIAVIIAVIIVVSMKLVGSLLVSALIIFPALAAMRVFKSFRSVTICSAVFSVICTLLGILISILLGTPVGSTIVCADIVGFLIFFLIGLKTAK
ncbi:MAG: metal ABC transporter permease, partial [Lachnospiraceae bacterium]|nr:metal ABC transporter permease [Lachnospiraceae bacterium]